MRLRILGFLELAGDGNRQVKIGGPRERAVLGALALRANQAVAVDRLIAAAWGDGPPNTARSQIQTCISTLRRAFGEAGLPEAIQTRPGGYLLKIGDGDLDSRTFTRLVAAAKAQVAGGRTAEAAAALREALGLWRGPALADIPGSIVQQGAAVLEEARLAALEERLRLDLELGRHLEVAGELAGLTAEHPLRERFYGLLMLAHYRSGLQAEALAVYRRARAALQAELGVEPCQELRDLERAVLNQDPGLALAAVAPPADGQGAPAGAAPRDAADEAPGPRQLPHSVADFIGRDCHLADIKQFLSAGREPGSTRYAVPIVAVSGPGGVGKSTLALRAAHELSEEFPDGHLYADLSGQSGEGLTTMLLARFLRALGVSGSMIPDDPAERAELYRSRLASKRLLLVLDDAGSERKVLPLLPGSPSCAVIVTSRTRLTGLPGARLITIDEFDDETSMTLLESIAGRERLRADPEAAGDLVRYCGGLPLALRIAGARLVSRPHWRIIDLTRRLSDERRRLDELSHHGLEVRSSIGLTYRSLPGRAQRLFRLLASVQAADFPAWTAAALLDTGLAEAEDLIEDLIEAEILDPVQGPDGDIKYTFHDLIRVYAQERLAEEEAPAARGAAIGRVLGGWLALAEQAHRAEYGGDYTTLHGSAPRWRPPGQDGGQPAGFALDWLESERAALVSAVRQAAAEGLAEVCWDLALTSVSLFEVKGYLDDWRETAELAYRAAARAGDQTGCAAMSYSLGTLHLFQKRLPEAERFFAEALTVFEAQGDVHGQALVLRNSAMVDRLRSDFERMAAKHTDALGKMRECGDVVGEASILRSLARFTLEEGDLEESSRMLSQALELCQRVGYRRGQAQMVAQLAEVYLRAGQVVSARQALHQVLRTVREIGDRVGETHVLYALGIVRYREGRLDTAEVTLANALTLAQRIGSRFVEGQARYALGEISLSQGDNAAATTHLAAAAAAFAEVGSPLWQAKTLLMLSESYDQADGHDAAQRYLEEAAGLLSRVSSKEAGQLVGRLNQVGAWLAAERGPGRDGTGQDGIGGLAAADDSRVAIAGSIRPEIAAAPALGARIAPWG